MYKNLGKFSFCLLLPKQTLISINTRDVDLCGGPWKFRSHHWQFLSRLTTFNSSEEAERFAQVKSLPWPSDLPLFSDLPQTKTIILFVKFMVGHYARAHMTQERSSEMIMANPLLLLVIYYFCSESFST